MKSGTTLCKDMFNITHQINILTIKAPNLHTIESDFLKNQPITGDVTIDDTKLEIIKKHTFRNLDISTIYLIFNQIKVIENEAFVDLKNFYHLDLRNNKLTIINAKAFVHVPSLNSLGFSYNRIQKLGKNVFNFVQNKNIHIHLSHNEIQILDENAFDGLKQVYLDLSHNSIEYFPSGVFENRRFEDIKLNYNPIKHVSDDFFGKNCNIHTFYIDYNFLDSDTVAKFKRWSVENKVRLTLSLNSGSANWKKSVLVVIIVNIFCC